MASHFTIGIALFVVFLITGAQSRVTTYDQAKTYDLGSSFEMECDTETGGVDSIVYFTRQAVYLAPFPPSSSRTTVLVPWILSRGDVIDPEFAESMRRVKGDRYTFTEVDSATRRIRLEISDMQPEDSGDIRCVVASADNITEQVTYERIGNITVAGAPISITWLVQYPNILVDVTALDVTEDQSFAHVFCVVRFPTVLPQSSVYLADKNGSIVQNVTDEFDVKKSIGSHITAERGYWKHDFGLVRAPVNDFTANYTYNGRHLVCNASVMQVEKNSDGVSVRSAAALTATLRLNVTHAPKILCDAEVAMMDGLAKTRCRVYSNPEAGISYRPYDDNTVDLEEFTQVDRTDHVEVTLSVNATTRATYAVEAVNPLGTETVLVRFGQEDTGGAGHCGLPLAVMLTSLLAAYFSILMITE